MQASAFAMPVIVLLITGLTGFITGVVLTVAVFRIQGLQASESSHDAPDDQSSTNPYHPSRVSTPTRRRTSVWAVMLAMMVSVLLGAGAFFGAIITFKNATQITPPPPPTVTTTPPVSPP